MLGILCASRPGMPTRERLCDLFEYFVRKCRTEFTSRDAYFISSCLIDSKCTHGNLRDQSVELVTFIELDYFFECCFSVRMPEESVKESALRLS